jgi:glucose/arabinose dehydrogenase
MKVALVLVLLAGCGDSHKVREAGMGQEPPAQRDAPPDLAIDSPMLQGCTPSSGTTMSMRKIGAVTGCATLATSPPNDPRLFVLARQGVIQIFDNEVLNAAPFLDISTKIRAGGEQGLLGLAFHPHYASNGYFYVFYTVGGCSTASPCFDVLERYSVSTADPGKADAASGQVILSIPDFATNHNGGMIEFGADGYLYVSTGDGGGAGDPHRNGLAIDRTAASCTQTQCEPLLGKILRIDVDHPANGKPYGIPSDNPFANGGGEPEIYVIGLRNPWRWSFDRATGDMWIGDVGQSLYEEVDVLAAGQQAGVNLGWSMYEGSAAYGSNYSPDPTGKTFPQVVKSHTIDHWAAIIGGQVYRGPCYAGLTGYYFYTDNVAHTLSRAQLVNGTVTTIDLAPPPGGWPASPASLHADSRGELYETLTTGEVYHLEAGP